jgi:hypothetical protein
VAELVTGPEAVDAAPLARQMSDAGKVDPSAFLLSHGDGLMHHESAARETGCTL